MLQTKLMMRPIALLLFFYAVFMLSCASKQTYTHMETDQHNLTPKVAESIRKKLTAPQKNSAVLPL